jgi:hypothetical protein
MTALTQAALLEALYQSRIELRTQPRSDFIDCLMVAHRCDRRAVVANVMRHAAGYARWGVAVAC